jgi:hypothetical protein
VLKVDRAAGERALVGLQVTSQSPLGAIALETGGLLVDHGWIRVLGGGSPRLPRAIHEWNRMTALLLECGPGWRRDVEHLPGDRGISVYPFLFAAGLLNRCSRPPGRAPAASA